MNYNGKLLQTHTYIRTQNDQPDQARPGQDGRRAAAEGDNVTGRLAGWLAGWLTHSARHRVQIDMVIDYISYWVERVGWVVLCE